MTMPTVLPRNFANAPKFSYILPAQCTYVFSTNLRTAIPFADKLYNTHGVLTARYEQILST